MPSYAPPPSRPRPPRGRRAALALLLSAALPVVLLCARSVGSVLSVCSVGSASAQELPKASPEAPQYIAIIELKNQAALRPEEVAYLTEVMRQAAKYLPAESYPLITKENLFMLLPPGTRVEDCQGECAVETGRKIGATWLITGEVVQISGTLRVLLELYHTPSNVRKGSDIVKGASIDELENPLLAATMTLLADLDPALLAKAERTRSGFVFKRVSVGALPELPEEAGRAAEEALKGVPAARADLKSLGFKDIDVEELESYDKALKLENDPSATPERRLAQWRALTSSPRLAPVAQEQVNKWSNFLARRQELEAKRLQAISQLNALKAEDARALEERALEKRAAWSKLSRLLTLSVIEESDKSQWVEAFLDAYGAVPELNEHIRAPALKPYLSAPALAARLPALEAQSRAELEARARRAEEIERRLCALSDDKEWAGGRCASLSERRACEGKHMRWEGGSCHETPTSCEARGLVLEGGSCALSPEERARRAEEEARAAREASYERARASLRRLLLNVADDDSIYELSTQSDAAGARQNISLDLIGVLGAAGLSLNLASGADGVGVSTLGLTFGGETDSGGAVGFGLYYPFGGGSVAARQQTFESKRLNAFGDRWRWDAERVSFTLPMSFAAPLKRGGWDLRLSLTPAVALSGGAQELPAGASAAWAGVEDPGSTELYAQSAVSLSRLLGGGGSLVGVRYQAHYSITSSSGSAHGAWAPYLHLRFGGVALKLEGLWQPSAPALAAFRALDEVSVRAALWFNTDRGAESEELCKVTLYTSVIGGVGYALYKGITALSESSDGDSSSDSGSDSGSDDGSVALYTLGYIALLTLPSALLANADDICD